MKVRLSWVWFQAPAFRQQWYNLERVPKCYLVSANPSENSLITVTSAQVIQVIGKQRNSASMSFVIETTGENDFLFLVPQTSCCPHHGLHFSNSTHTLWHYTTTFTLNLSKNAIFFFFETLRASSSPDGHNNRFQIRTIHFLLMKEDSHLPYSGPREFLTRFAFARQP